ncbi:MAG TPA: hypothetical protein VJ912_00470 [Candidatus Nanoarchaeia archaeon]|nr:hypothetical protein [Candidatus Nanoarchaeia archaeon]
MKFNFFLKSRIKKALKNASHHHHNYEKEKLKGKRDKKWSGWYAGYILGRIRKLQKIFSVSKLANLLEEASKKSKQENWAEKYAHFIVEGMGKTEKNEDKQ